MCVQNGEVICDFFCAKFEHIRLSSFERKNDRHVFEFLPALFYSELRKSKPFAFIIFEYYWLSWYFAIKSMLKSPVIVSEWLFLGSPSIHLKFD